MNRNDLKKWLNDYLINSTKRGLTGHVNGKKCSSFIKNSILNETEYLPINVKMGERIYNILNDIYERPMCKQCKINYVKYNGSQYRTFCSKQCKYLNSDIKEKTKNTCKEKYGCDFTAQSQNVKNKIKQTFNKKYNGHPMRNNDIKNKMNKTCDKKYNGHPMKNKEICKKSKDTFYKNNIINVHEFLKSIDLKLVNEYIESKTIVDFQCLKCKKIFKTGYFNIQQGKRCPYCSTEYEQSKEEIEIYNYLTSILPDIEIIKNETQLIKNPKTKNNLELDIYIPDKKIAIEYNGLYWHSNLYKDKNYHLMKTNLCKEKGVKLIHIFEDEWIYEKENVKNKLNDILLQNYNQLNYNELQVKEILNNDKIIILGLFKNNELKYKMIFINENNYIYKIKDYYFNNIIIFKFINYFQKYYNWKELNVYIDIRWNNEKIYEKMNFKYIKYLFPQEWYFKRDELKRIFKNDILKKNENKYLKIYDCGYVKYKLKNKNYIY
jgi:hypothetical protein